MCPLQLPLLWSYHIHTMFCCKTHEIVHLIALSSRPPVLLLLFMLRSSATYFDHIITPYSANISTKVNLCALSSHLYCDHIISTDVHALLQPPPSPPSSLSPSGTLLTPNTTQVLRWNQIFLELHDIDVCFSLDFLWSDYFFFVSKEKLPCSLFIHLY